MPLAREKIGFGLGFLGMVGFAGTVPATRLAVAAMDPLFLTAARASIAGCLGLATLLATRRRVPGRSLWPDLIVTALCSIIGYPLCAAFAMQTVPAAHAGVVLGISPLATAAAAALLAHERPSRGFWLAGLVGAALVIGFALRRASGNGGALAVGDLFLLGSIVAGALGYTASGRLVRHMPGWEIICWAVVLMLPLALVATAALWPPDIAAVPWDAWAALAYVGIVSQFLAFFVWNAAMAIGGIARVAQLFLLQPFTIVALAALINRERIDMETILFAVAVVATVFVGQRMQVVRRA
jgi:drug/metabolite transporter (DMT)-like permease